MCALALTPFSIITRCHLEFDKGRIRKTNYSIGGHIPATATKATADDTSALPSVLCLVKRLGEPGAMTTGDAQRR